jgi:hypothetical protein
MAFRAVFGLLEAFQKAKASGETLFHCRSWPAYREAERLASTRHHKHATCEGMIVRSMDSI